MYSALSKFSLVIVCCALIAQTSFVKAQEYEGSGNYESDMTESESETTGGESAEGATCNAGFELYGTGGLILQGGQTIYYSWQYFEAYYATAVFAEVEAAGIALEMSPGAATPFGGAFELPATGAGAGAATTVAYVVIVAEVAIVVYELYLINEAWNEQEEAQASIDALNQILIEQHGTDPESIANESANDPSAWDEYWHFFYEDYLNW